MPQSILSTCLGSRTVESRLGSIVTHRLVLSDNPAYYQNRHESLGLGELGEIQHAMFLHVIVQVRQAYSKDRTRGHEHNVVRGPKTLQASYHLMGTLLLISCLRYRRPSKCVAHVRIHFCVPCITRRSGHDVQDLGVVDASAICICQAQ